MKTLSLLAVSQLKGVARETCRRRFRNAGIDPKPGRRYTAREISAAFGGFAAKLNAVKLRRWEAMAANAEHDLQQLQSKLIPVSTVDAIHARNVDRLRRFLDAAFRVELPPKQAGMSADKIAKMNSEYLDSIYREMEKPLK